jgi:hypothetical protein
MRKTHVRNVAGIQLKQISRAVYEQTYPDGQRRWYVRFKVGDTEKIVWHVTMKFKEKPTHQYTQPFETLTDAVMHYNVGKGKKLK